MTQEDKQLLLADLCGRLSYGVKFQLTDDDGIVYNTTLTGIDLDTGIFYGADIDCSFGRCQIENIKPYLRPMSSMTEEESAELSNIISGWYDEELFMLTEEPFLEYALSKINYSINPRLFDWLNKNMFDYRGLIPKDLALSTDVFNPYKD